MRKQAKIIVFSFIFALCSTGFASELLVPSPYPTIQSAIDAAAGGDTVIVAPGNYTGPGNRDIDFLGKAITVRSEAGPQSCVIDCEGLGRGFYFGSNETRDSVLEGFTIMNGYLNQPDWVYGAGIYCRRSRPTIKNCVITNCQTNGQWAYGGGIACRYSEAIIDNCIINDNTANGQWAYGGGIYTSSGVTIVNCVVSDNLATSYFWKIWADGGGIYCDCDNGTVTITNCTITENRTSHSQGGGIYSEDTIAIISNCIIYNNGSPIINDGGVVTVTYSDIQNGWIGEGNIDTHPFLTPDGHLQAGSPCIDAGDPDFLPEPGQVDIDGEPRIMRGRVDMGADEVTAPLLSAMVLSAREFQFDANEDRSNPQPQILSIRNMLEDTLNWEITEDCPWLQVQPNIGTSSYEPNYITLDVDVTGLAAGVYNCTLTISSPNAAFSPRIVNVNLVVHGPIIAVSPEKVEFEYIPGGPNPPDQTLEIRNISGGTLNWVISRSDCNWLEVIPVSGSSRGEVNEVNLNVDVSALPLGVYSCTLSVIDPNAENNPQTVAVILYVYNEIHHVPSEFSTIQAAIDAAQDGTLIIVAPGTYTGPGNWDIDFLGKAITVRSADPNDPNIVAGTIIDCNNTSGHCGFYFHNNEDANSVLAGFTITNSSRSGIYCYMSVGPTITNCTIAGNSAFRGGGIYFSGFRDLCPKITNCTITNNSASWGGGIYCSGDGSPTITNCTIAGNSAEDGGGIYIGIDSVMGWRPKITNCTITDNSARNGGGIYFSDSRSVITGCTIAGNSASNGGGIYSRGFPVINSCTITSNSARFYGGGIYNYWTTLNIANSIIWGNADSSGTGQSAQVYDYIDTGGTEVLFSCIQDDDPNDANIPFDSDSHNIDDDPCFVEPGFWDANNIYHNGDYHLLPISPCIEAGDPYYAYHIGDVDMDGQPRLMGPRVDMGADEFDTKMIVVTKPEGGEVWTGGSTHEITWDSYGITGTVDISYSTNNGANWTKIYNAPDIGSFIWDLPGAADSNQCLVLVEPNSPTPNLTCIESGLFTIQPYRSLPTKPGRPECQDKQIGPEYGCIKWQLQTGGPVTAGVAIGQNNRVYVPCEDGKLYTINAGGALLWTYDTGSPLVCSPAVDSRGNVYIGAENGKLYAIDKNGRLLWTHTTNGPIYSTPVVLFDNSFCGHPRLHTQPWEQPFQIFVCSVDGALYALGQDGSELWTFETDSVSAVTTGAIFASPATDDSGTLHISGIYDPNLYALDSNSVDIEWNLAFPDPCRAYSKKPWPFASPVIAEDGTIYQALLYDPNLYAINPNDGSIIWSVDLADPCSGWFEPNYAQIYGHPACWSKPGLAPDGTIYVSFNDPYLRAVDPNGTIRWVTKLGIIGGFTLTVGGDGLIYAASDDAHLYVVDPDGQQVSQFDGFGGLSFPTITTGRTLIISDANNTVWAISQGDCQDPVLALRQVKKLNSSGALNRRLNKE